MADEKSNYYTRASIIFYPGGPIIDWSGKTRAKLSPETGVPAILPVDAKIAVFVILVTIMLAYARLSG